MYGWRNVIPLMGERKSEYWANCNAKFSLLYEKTFLSLQDRGYSFLLGLSPSSVSVEKYVLEFGKQG